ncbi:MAG: AAA family ATPase [Alphaproteobacteria bacterium]
MDQHPVTNFPAQTARELAAQADLLSAFSQSLEEQHGQVTRIDTHASVIFLAGDRAYKVKRAVRYPFLDYATLGKREIACKREFEINKAMSPVLYVGCAALIKRQNGGVTLVPDTPPADIPACEWAVVMHRFGDDQLLSTMAEQDFLSRTLVEETSRLVATTHAAAQPVAANERHGGGCRRFNEMVSETITALTRQHDPDTIMQLTRIATIMAAQITGFAPRLDDRLADNLVRHCHGDLHLANICLFNNKPTLFDAVEFNPTISTIDCLYDTSFLWMDLIARGHADLANNAMNTYLPYFDRYEDSGLIGLYMAARALIRARVAYTRAMIIDGSDAKQAARRDARHYLNLAEQCLAQAQPSLIVVGGLSGSGKTTLARNIAPHIGGVAGAIHIRSDVVRKRLHNIDPLTPLPPSAYTKESSVTVYQAMIEQARAALKAGMPVIMDAVYAHDDERQAVARLAVECGVPFSGLWLSAPLQMRVNRVAERNNDASDADVNIVRKQDGTCIIPQDWHALHSAGDKTCIRNKAFHTLVADGHRVALDMDQRGECCTSVS